MGLTAPRASRAKRFDVCDVAGSVGPLSGARPLLVEDTDSLLKLLCVTCKSRRFPLSSLSDVWSRPTSGWAAQGRSGGGGRGAARDRFVHSTCTGRTPPRAQLADLIGGFDGTSTRDLWIDSGTPPRDHRTPSDPI